MPGSPTHSIGQVVTADEINNWFITGAQARSTDQSVTSSTVLVNDDTLLAAVVINAIYHVEAELVFLGGTQGSSDLKISWTAPAGVTMNWIGIGKDTAGAFTWPTPLTTPTATAAFGTLGAAVRMARVEGSLITGATPGTLQLQWAQNTSSATATTMKAGSILKLTRVA